ncbi:MAG: sialidase family protein [Nitrososphaerales archaeon]
MSDLTVPIVAGFAVGIAFIVMFAVFSSPPPILTIVDNWVVVENLTQRYTFGSAVRIPDTAGAGGINTGSSGSNLYLTWHAPSGVFFATTSDGATFGSKISLTNRTIINKPLIAAHENDLYLVWSATDNNGMDFEIFFRASHDNGVTFDPIINQSDNINIESSQNPDIAVSGNNVYVVWEDRTTGEGRILLRTSNDRGSTFGSAIDLSDGRSSREPQIAVSNNNVYVIWHEIESKNRIVLKASNDNGVTFNKETNLRIRDIGEVCCPQIAAYGNDVYVIWADSDLKLVGGHYDLHFRASHNKGITFGRTTSLTDIARDYQIAVSGNNVYVVWTNVLPINANIENAEAFFVRSKDKGITFENPINLSSNEGPSSNQEIAVSNNEVYVAWVDHTLDYDEILFRGSNDYGASFGKVINLSNGTGISVDQHIVVADQTMYIVWKEFGDESHDDGIYVVRRIN